MIDSRVATYLVKNTVQASIERHLKLLEEHLLRHFVDADILGVSSCQDTRAICGIAY